VFNAAHREQHLNQSLAVRREFSGKRPVDRTKFSSYIPRPYVPHPRDVPSIRFLLRSSHQTAVAGERLPAIDPGQRNPWPLRFHVPEDHAKGTPWGLTTHFVNLIKREERLPVSGEATEELPGPEG